MCDACADVPFGPFPQDAAGVDRLWDLARAFEAAQPGPPAPADAWEIFRGRRSGSLAFAVVERLAGAFAAARQAHVVADPIAF